MGALVFSGAMSLALFAHLTGQQQAGTRESMTVGVKGMPYSSDPVDYDTIVNALVFSATHATLVTRQRKGEYLGVLAENWEASRDFRRWTFRFRGDVRFQNGELVTPRHLAAAWVRMARLQHSRSSESGFLQKLVGYEDLSQSGQIRGLDFSSHTVSLAFREPMAKLLEFASSGMYAVAHPNCMGTDPHAWNCHGSDIASGPYSITEWTDDAVRMELRPDFPPHLRHPRAAPRIELRIATPPLSRFDIIIGDSPELLQKDGFTFSGGMESAIAYARCTSWTDPGSVCHDKRTRMLIRQRFYAELNRLGIRATSSFFPLSVPGVREPGVAATTEPADPTPPKKGRISVRNPTPFLAPITGALTAAARGLGIETEVRNIPRKDMDRELAPGLPRYENDVAIETTEITIDDPATSVRFMFGSKEGIMLPDPRGLAKLALLRQRVDFQELNKILWEDALIWPITHYAMGAWAKRGVDLSPANMTVFPPPLHWMGPPSVSR